MKNFFAISILLFAFLTACNSETPAASETETTSEISADGYFVENGYLWKDETQLIATGIAKDSTDEEASIWNSFTDSGYLYLFLSGGAGCEGCVWYEKNYFAINTETEEVELKQFDDASFFARGIPTLSLLSPDGKKVMFVKAENQFSESTLLRDESVWVYDLILGKETEVTDIPVEQSVLSCANIFCELNGDKIYWTDSTPVVLPSVKPEYTYSQVLENDADLIEVCSGKDCAYVSILGYERGEARRFGDTGTRGGYFIYETIQQQIIEDNLDDTRFVSHYFLKYMDFNGDDVKEYLLYYNDDNNGKPALPGDNVKIFRWSGSEWLIDFELHEGTICGSCDKATLIPEVGISLIYDEENGNGILLKTEKTNNGNHQSYEYIYLGWNGSKIAGTYYSVENLPEKLENR
jgi:hypothetical protein